MLQYELTIRTNNDVERTEIFEQDLLLAAGNIPKEKAA